MEIFFDYKNWVVFGFYILSYMIIRRIIFSVFQVESDRPLKSFEKDLFWSRLLAVVPLFNIFIAIMARHFSNRENYEFLYSLEYAREWAENKESEIDWE